MSGSAGPSYFITDGRIDFPTKSVSYSGRLIVMSILRSSVNRRFFLHAAGVTLALPGLESLSLRGFGKSGEKAKRPVRMVCVGNSLGFHAPAFFPKATGTDYDFPTELEPLKPHRKDYTLFSGLDHGVKGGHFAVHSFLSGVRSVDAKSMPEGNISIDQRAAETIGGATRFPSLTIGSEDGIHGGTMMCWTRSGTRVPPITGPNELFRKLFVNDTAAERARAGDRFQLKGSILDAINGDAKSLERRLDQRDRDKLDEYFTSVRDVEKQLELGRQWSQIAKPSPGIPEPRNTEMVSDLPALYDLMALALQTDSTRIATLEIAGDFRSSAFGLRKGYHALSHHGQVKESIESLVKMERYQVEQFARFLGKLKSIEDGDKSLLDNTMLLLGSGMGNANSHTNTNLPIVLAGGGFRHGEYQAYPQKGPGKVPLCNLFVSMLQRFGVETDQFGPGRSTLTGLA